VPAVVGSGIAVRRNEAPTPLLFDFDSLGKSRAAGAGACIPGLPGLRHWKGSFGGQKSDLDFVAISFGFVVSDLDFVAPGLDFVAARLEFIARPRPLKRKPPVD
jgi:hypothetical protein